MAINLEDFFRKLLFARQLEVKEGRMEIYGIPYVLFPAKSFTLLIDSLLEVAGKKGSIEIYKQGVKVGIDIANTLKRSLRATGNSLLDTIWHIGGLGGWGLWELYEKDEIKKEGVVRGYNISTAQEAYKIKKRKEPHCHLLRGIIAGEMRVVWNNKSLDIIETRCIAQGYPHCEFFLKPRNKFTKSNKFVKSQLP